MRLRYAISLWNYTHYSQAPSLEEICQSLRQEGYGIELWGSWRDEPDLYGQAARHRLQQALAGMAVSLHTAGAPTWALHRKQIDAAAALGAGVVVLHPRDLVASQPGGLDAALARRAVAYAAERGVRLALENGPLPFLAQAAEQVPGLGICLDVGHVYATPDPMAAFLAALGERIIHLHIQDVVAPPEAGLAGAAKDHYVPGTGGIPRADWELLVRTLRQVDYQGLAVFEIQPRRPLQTAFLARGFLAGLLD